MNPRRRRFVAEYLVDLNATQAAIRAGYSKKTAGTQAEQLLRNLEIAAAVAKAQAGHIQKLDVEALRVLQELGRLATSDLRKCFDASGNLLPINELPDEVAAAVSGIEVVMRSSGRDEPPEYVHKIRLWDKNTALQNLAKHFGLLKELVEHTGKDGGPIETSRTIKVSDLNLSEASLREILEKTKMREGGGS